MLEILKNDYELPSKVLGIIDHFTSLTVPVGKLSYPSSAAYAESIHNQTEERKHMGIFEGLPISPWLANVMIHSCLMKAGWLGNKEMSVRLYADDISIFLTQKGYEFMGQDFIEKWNQNPIFRDHGIQIDKAKSKWVKPRWTMA